MMHSRALPLLLLTSLTLPASAQQPSADSRTGAVLTVKGEGRIDVKPDYAQSNATVSTKGRSLAETAAAHEERATRALSVLQGLKGAGVEIITSSFRLNQDPPSIPQGRPPTSEKPSEPRFTAVTSFDFRVKPIDGLNGVITKLASSGLFEMRGVIFRVEQERTALNEARRAAVLDARDQAEAYADAGGVRLVEVIEISDGEAIPLSATGEADLARAPYVQIVPPAVVAFTATVKIVWRIAPR
ncbi:MAG TPA: SIMPL domain-containing protein [Xanthobacteraceae bacterium]|nr:SIMPL domain-containing protein [Xanthobacteraceae bacterium]